MKSEKTLSRGPTDGLQDGTRLETGQKDRTEAKAWSSLGLLSRGFLVIILVSMIALAGGYWFFRMEIERLAQKSADWGNAIAESRSGKSAQKVAIAVLTGDVGRIETGMALFEKGYGERVLISGVHERTSRAAMLKAANLKPSTTSCCIDIGHMALNTRGNALETAQWFKRNRFDSLLVVTSDYHMPRSLLELAHTLRGADMEGVSLYPVVAGEAGLMPQVRNLKASAKLAPLSGPSGGQLRHSLKEYGKYLAAIARIWFETGLTSGAGAKDIAGKASDSAHSSTKSF